MKKLLVVLLTLILLACASYLKSPLRPLVWHPPVLQNLQIPEKKFIHEASIDMAPYIAHEDSAVDRDGNLYTGGFDPEINKGYIFKIAKGTTQAEKWIELGEGKINGLAFDKENNLWACDSMNGLIKVSLTDKTVEYKLQYAEGVEFGLINDLTISDTGSVYMTDSSMRKPFNIRHELVESVPTGRLLSLTKEGQSSILLEQLFWPNGLLLSKDEQFIYLSEMGYYRIWKFWLKGPRAGDKDIWVDNLVGFPNGISYSKNGTVLVGLIADRSPLLDAIHPFPILKRFIGSLPELLQPKQSTSGRLLEYSQEGKLLNSWYDNHEGKIIEVSSAEPWGSSYVIGNDRQTSITVVDLDK